MNKLTLLPLALSIMFAGCSVTADNGSAIAPNASPNSISTKHASPAHVSPSYDCNSSSLTSIETLICQDDELATLDNQMSKVYRQAVIKANNEYPPILKAEQRGWIKGRNDCWKSDDKKLCVTGNYIRRITELQAKYRLVAHSKPILYTCDNTPANEVIVTYFETSPASLIAEYGDRVSFMTIQPSASGAKYQGQNEQLWEHNGEAMITWGFQSPEMKCKLAQ
ncbi:MliC family protein [Shewanella mesophila]|uniref:MliC family protein n=1 Tax=Shewanella mesophila TaxID=2864208 RepID=UPI001C660D98|nr:MliC family protein [Shewanella mesophila]QYJ86668.1 MliC family protein [Shewanella mesophila]